MFLYSVIADLLSLLCESKKFNFQDVVHGSNGKRGSAEYMHRGKEKLKLDRTSLDVICVEL